MLRGVVEPRARGTTRGLSSALTVTAPRRASITVFRGIVTASVSGTAPPGSCTWAVPSASWTRVVSPGSSGVPPPGSDVPATVHVCVAGVGSGVPQRSTAATLNVCRPGARPE